MYGKSPYGYPGAQVTPGFPGTAQQMKGKPDMMMEPPMMRKPWMGDKTMAGKMMGRPVPVAPEESYVENILRMNRGKVATIYTTNENNPEWAAKVFRGRVENAARDHVVVSDPETGMRYMILMVNIDFITFDEPLRYEPTIYGW